MGEEITTKEDVSPEAIVALAASLEISIAPDRIEVIGQRLKELFDLAAPLEGSDFKKFEVTRPFDPRWTKGASA